MQPYKLPTQLDNETGCLDIEPVQKIRPTAQTPSYIEIRAGGSMRIILKKIYKKYLIEIFEHSI